MFGSQQHGSSEEFMSFEHFPERSDVSFLNEDFGTVPDIQEHIPLENNDISVVQPFESDTSEKTLPIPEELEYPILGDFSDYIDPNFDFALQSNVGTNAEGIEDIAPEIPMVAGEHNLRDPEHTGMELSSEFSTVGNNSGSSTDYLCSPLANEAVPSAAHYDIGSEGSVSPLSNGWMEEGLVAFQECELCEPLILSNGTILGTGRFLNENYFVAMDEIISD